jgi:mono/diheme cytochrome c family protein
MRFKSVTLALLLAGPGAALAQQPQPPAGDALFTRACATCHQAGKTIAASTAMGFTAPQTSGLLTDLGVDLCRRAATWRAT